MIANLLHLAAALKRLLTILFLFILAGQASGYCLVNTHEISFSQETEGSGLKICENKNEKEYLPSIAVTEYQFCKKISFASYYAVTVLQAVFDQHTPPPDQGLSN